MTQYPIFGAENEIELDGLTWLTLSPQILRQIYATAPAPTCTGALSADSRRLSVRLSVDLSRAWP